MSHFAGLNQYHLTSKDSTFRLFAVRAGEFALSLEMSGMMNIFLMQSFADLTR